ncbi:MAG: hypothetical protein FWE06_05735 [Oscillospiraceae bacterium]|nr:hypothetical protein [Oscillospiraceae bacterium]
MNVKIVGQGGHLPIGDDRSPTPQKPQGNGLRYWFINVFWYHYKIHFIIACVLLIGATSFVITLIRNRPPDFQMVILTQGSVIFPDAPELSRLLSNELGDQNGDGRAVSHVHVLGLSRANPNFYQHTQQAMIYFNDPSIVLYVVDAAMREQFSRFFEPDNNPLDVSQTPMFQRIGRSDQPYYVFMRLRTAESVESNYRLAEQALTAILNYE